MKQSKISFLFFIWIILPEVLLVPFQKIDAQQTKDSTYFYYYKILTPRTVDDLPEGYRYFKKYKEDRSAKKDTINVVYALRMLFRAEYEMGRTHASEASAIEALTLLDTASDSIKGATIAEAGVYNHLGIVYYSTNRPKKAIETYEKALKKAPAVKDSITLLNNMANAYSKLENYQKAISTLEWVYRKSLESEDKTKTAKALDNLGYIKSKAGYDEGLIDMLEALALRKEINDPGQLFTSYNHLTEHYKNTGDLKAARNYAALGKEVASQVSAGYKKEALAQSLALSENEEVVEYMRMTDSIVEASLQQDNKFSSIEYDFTKEQERTQAALLESEKERRLKSIFQVVGVGLVLLAIGLYFLLKFRHRKDKAVQLYNTESKISKIVHDEVANDLYQIMVRIQTARDSDNILLDNLEDVYNKTRDISKEHSPIQTNKDFSKVLIALLQNYQSEQVNIITKNINSIKWSAINDLKKITLYRVLQELMTNMRKHSEASLVVISANQSGKAIQITYSDNGVGGEIKRGNGLLNTENRIRSAKGTIIFDSIVNKGFTAKISL